MAFMNICGSILFDWAPFEYSISIFFCCCLIKVNCTFRGFFLFLYFLFLWSGFYWHLCITQTVSALDVTMIFAFIIHVLNMETHSAQYLVNVMSWAAALHKLWAIAEKIISKWKANWVYRVSSTSAFHSGLTLNIFWLKTCNSLTNWSFLSFCHWFLL